MKYLIVFSLLFSVAFADQPSELTRPPSQEITPKAQPLVKNGVTEPYVTTDFIYWKAREDGLEYLITGTGSVTRPSQTKGKIYQPDFDGHVGFKVGLGLNIGHDGWDVYLQNTWLDADESDWFQGDFARELIGEPFLVGGVTHASVDWDFHIRVLDLEWGRHFYISPFLLLRPFFGLKGFWSDQDYKAKVIGFSNANRTETGRNTSHFDEDSWGIGIRAGVQTSWSFTRNFSLFGNLALATEWCRFHLKLKQTAFFDETNASTVLVNLNNHQYEMIPVLELALGLRWEMWWAQDSYHVMLQWGCEEQMWWNYARSFENFNVLSTGNDLNFQGLTVRARFDF